MTRTLFRNFDLVATMDDDRREIEGGYVLVEGNRIVALGEDPTELLLKDRWIMLTILGWLITVMMVLMEY